MNADGSDEIPLTSYDPNTNAGDSDDPSWSPIGQQITFERDLYPTPSPEIFTMNADGSDVTQRAGLPKGLPTELLGRRALSGNRRRWCSEYGRSATRRR